MASTFLDGVMAALRDARLQAQAQPQGLSRAQQRQAFMQQDPSQQPTLTPGPVATPPPSVAPAVPYATNINGQIVGDPTVGQVSNAPTPPPPPMQGPPIPQVPYATMLGGQVVGDPTAGRFNATPLPPPAPVVGTTPGAPVAQPVVSFTPYATNINGQLAGSADVGRYNATPLPPPPPPPPPPPLEPKDVGQNPQSLIVTPPGFLQPTMPGVVQLSDGTYSAQTLTPEIVAAAPDDIKGALTNPTTDGSPTIWDQIKQGEQQRAAGQLSPDQIKALDDYEGQVLAVINERNGQQAAPATAQPVYKAGTPGVTVDDTGTPILTKLTPEVLGGLPADVQRAYNDQINAIMAGEQQRKAGQLSASDQQLLDSQEQQLILSLNNEQTNRQQIYDQRQANRGPIQGLLHDAGVLGSDLTGGASSASAMLQKPREWVDTQAGGLIYQLVTNGANPTILQMAKNSPLPILDTYNAMVAWAGKNPQAVKDAYEKGYTDPLTGKTFTGGRAVWEKYESTRNIFQRGLDATLSDPTMLLPAVGEGGQVIRRGGEIIATAADATKTDQIVGKGLQIAGRLLEAPNQAANAPADALFGGIKAGVGAAREASPLVDRLLSESPATRIKKTAARIMQTAENQKLAEQATTTTVPEVAPKAAPDIIFVKPGETLPLEVANGPEKPVYVLQPDGPPIPAGTTINPAEGVKKPLPTDTTLTNEAMNAPAGEVRQGSIFGEVQGATPLREGPPLFARDTGTGAIDPISSSDWTPDGAGKATVTVTTQDAPVQIVRGDGTVIETVPAQTVQPLTMGEQEMGAIYDLGWTNRKRVSAIITQYGERYPGQTDLFQEQVQESFNKMRAAEQAGGRTNPLASARFNVEVQRAFENAYAGTDATLPDYVFRNEVVAPGTFQANPKGITVRQAIETAVWSPSDEDAKAARAWLNKRPAVVKTDTGLNANEVANQTRELRKERLDIPQQSGVPTPTPERVPTPDQTAGPATLTGGDGGASTLPAWAANRIRPINEIMGRSDIFTRDGYDAMLAGVKPLRQGTFTGTEQRASIRAAAEAGGYLPARTPAGNPVSYEVVAGQGPGDYLVIHVGDNAAIYSNVNGVQWQVEAGGKVVGTFPRTQDLPEAVAAADQALAATTPPSGQTLGIVPPQVQRLVAASLPTAREQAATQMAHDLSSVALPERARAAIMAPEDAAFLNTTFQQHPQLRGTTYGNARAGFERKVTQDMRDFAALKNAQQQGPLGAGQQKLYDQLEARYAPLGQLAIEEPLPQGLGGYVNGGLTVGAQDVPTHWVPNPEFPVAAAVHSDLAVALRPEFNYKEPGKVARWYDRQVIGRWQKLRLLAPWNFLHYLMGNIVGDSSQMAMAGYADAATRQMTEWRAMWDLARNPGYGMMDSPFGETLRRAGKVPPHDITSANMSEVTLADTGSRALRRIQGKSQPGWIGSSINSYKDLARNVANTLEWSRRSALADHLIQTGSVASKQDLIREAMVMAEKPGGRWDAIDPTEVQAVIDSLGTVFSPNDVREAVEKYAVSKGLNAGSAGKYADALGRRWATLQNQVFDATVKEVNRVLFSYEYTNLDEALKRVVPFHFWATRALPFYVEQGMRHPGLIAAYYRMSNATSKENAAAGWPPYLAKAWDVVHNTPLGYALFWNPMAAVGAISLLSDVGGNDATGANIVGKALNTIQSTTGLTLYPWFRSILNMSGAYGKTSLGIDPLGTEKERRLFGMVVQTLANQGLLGPNADRLIGKPYEQFLDEVRGKFGDLVGNNIGVPDANSGPKAQLSAIIQSEIRQRDQTPDGTPLSQQQLQEANDALVDATSPLYQRALNTYVQQNWMTNGINLVVPGYVQAVNTDLNATYNAGKDAKTGQAAPKEKGTFNSLWRPTDPYADGVVTPEEQQWLAKWKEATGQDYKPGDLLSYQDKARLQSEVTYGSPSHNKLILAQAEIKTIGTDQQRAAYNTYYDILYGNGPATIGGQSMTQAQLQGMTDTQRKFLADQWLGEDPQRALDLGAMKDLRKAYSAAHPEYQAYEDWRSAVNKQPSLAAYRVSESQVNPNAARYYKDQRAYIVKQNPTMPPSEVEKKLDMATTSIAGYEAVKGLQGDIRSPQPTDTGTLPADVAMVGAGGSGGTSTPADPVAKLQKEVQDYQTKAAQANAYLTQIYGFPVDVSMLPPGPVLNTALAQLPPGFLPSATRARNYLDWARGQQAQGQPADIATYIKVYGP